MARTKSDQQEPIGVAKGRGTLKRRVLQLAQSKDSAIYLFALTGEELLAVADVSRISRDEAGKLIGYQRPEVKRHVREIVEYLDGPDVLFPHAVIVAFSSKVRFVGSRGPNVTDGLSKAGDLFIPLPGDSGDAKPGCRPARVG